MVDRLHRPKGLRVAAKRLGAVLGTYVGNGYALDENGNGRWSLFVWGDERPKDLPATYDGFPVTWRGGVPRAL